jgi:hypothetical protein
MPVPVGNGLLNADLEAALIGMAAGESKTLSVDGSDVTVTVEKIVRTVLPELTDETVAGFGMEGVATVADLRRYCIGRQVERFVLEDENPDMASAFVWQQTAKNSRVVRDPEEVAAAEKKAAKKLAELQALSERESAAAEEDEAECEPDEEEEDGGPVSEELVRTMFLNEIDLAAIGQRMMELRGVCVTADDYRRYIDKLCEACPEKTRAAVEAEHTALDFTVNECANYVAHAIDQFVQAQYKEFFTRE